MFWGFLLPVGLILIYNIVLLVLISLAACRADSKLSRYHRKTRHYLSGPQGLRGPYKGTETNSTKHWTWTKKFLTSFSLTVLLGLSWTLGYLVLVTTGHSHLVFSIFFCLCTTTQGFQIFILFTARTRTFRATVSKSVQYVSSVNIPLHKTKYSFTNSWDTTTTCESYRDLKDEHTSTSKIP
ncbi:adhesion G-protein coupled receptor G7-like [Anabas testudineus]|uniref:adhesion G-protein coupled receptor G7-like n=1 Tax=Anabas testudineus TaxID=64144 RepID=UPI00143D7E21|nr:adhesion G-protein coupled receptor G7-like [Anabas testudineus]